MSWHILSDVHNLGMAFRTSKPFQHFYRVLQNFFATPKCNALKLPAVLG